MNVFATYNTYYLLTYLKMAHSFIQNCCCVTLQVSHHQEWKICAKNRR